MRKTSRVYVRKPVSERLFSKCQKDERTGCLVCSAARDRLGYCRIYIPGNRPKKMQLAHRVAWELVHGPVPDGLCVLHNCPAGDNPSCVNVEHLFLGTMRDNTQDMIAKGRHKYVTRRGEEHGRARFTAEQILSMFRDQRANKVIAAEHKTAPGVVARIKRGASWASVTGIRSIA
jgi:hypothetical protein